MTTLKRGSAGRGTTRTPGHTGRNTMSNEQFNLLDKDVLTTGEVAKICNVASRTVSKWFDSGQLKGYRIPGSKDRRIPVANLLTFMREHEIPMDGLMSGRPRVLICDQDEGVIDTLTSVLGEQTNFDVHTCDSLFAAGMECERFRPHVMLYELGVSDDDGRQLCSMIRGNEELQVTRIIAMSSRVTDGQTSQLMQSGFDGVLRKPFTVRQVIEAVETAHAVVY
ncbi:MAG: hypothetical protein CMJ52_09625 [Planctomycetaceae bacterium]|nr:hypothetical protein [Planctomycetaceae bacterium]